MEIEAKVYPQRRLWRYRSSFTLPEWFTTDCCKAAYNYVLMYRGSPTRSHCYVWRIPTMAFYDGASVYFLRKTKMADGHFLGFRRALLGYSVFSHVAPLGHSTVGVLITVKVSWRFGCAHARSSRRIIFNSSMCRRTYVALCKCSTCSFSIL